MSNINEWQEGAEAKLSCNVECHALCFKKIIKKKMHRDVDANCCSSDRTHTDRQTELKARLY